MNHVRIPIFVATLTLTVCGCQKPAALNVPVGQSAPAADEVAMIEVTAGKLADEVVVAATLDGYEQTALMSRIEGYVGHVAADIGSEVVKGEVLAELDVPEMAAEMQRRERLVAKAEADLASQAAEVARSQAQAGEQLALMQLRESELARTKTLVDSGALTKERLDEAHYAREAVAAALDRTRADINAAEAHLHSAEADVAVAQAELLKTATMVSYLQIKAPFDGVITERSVDPGAYVRPPSGGSGAMPLFKITSGQRLRAVVMLPIEDAGKLDIGDPVILHSIRGLPGVQIESQIARHSKALARGSRMMRAEVDIDNPADAQSGKRRLKPGDYGKMTVVLARYERQPTVPESAVGTDAGGDFVVTMDGTGRNRKQYVDVLLRKSVATNNGDKVMYAVLGGEIQVGDQVVAERPESVKNIQP